MTSSTAIIIVGAGPAGLMLSLLLARAKIPSLVLEQSAQPTDDTRAVFYNAASQFEFKRARIEEQVSQQGFQIRSAAFRDLQGKRLFTMPGAGQIGLIQKELTAIVQGELEKEEYSKIFWSHTVVGLGQDEDMAWVDVETDSGTQRLTAKYIVGCDGGSSTIRQGLFGRDALRGFTWEFPLVAADVTLNPSLCTLYYFSC